MIVTLIITEYPDIYKQTPELAYTEQEQWLEKVIDYPGLKYIKRKHTNKNLYAIQLIEEIIPLINDFAHNKVVANDKKVFLSYSRADKNFVEKLKRDLENNGIKIWYDEKNLYDGDIIKEAILEGINQSDCFLFVISPNSIKSDWVKFELKNAFDQHEKFQKRIIPVLIGDMSEKDLPQILQKHLFSDLRIHETYNQSLKKLCNSLKK